MCTYRVFAFLYVCLFVRVCVCVCVRASLIKSKVRQETERQGEKGNGGMRLKQWSIDSIKHKQREHPTLRRAQRNSPPRSRRRRRNPFVHNELRGLLFDFLPVTQLEEVVFFPSLLFFKQREHQQPTPSFCWRLEQVENINHIPKPGLLTKNPRENWKPMHLNNRWAFERFEKYNKQGIPRLLSESRGTNRQ